METYFFIAFGRTMSIWTFAICLGVPALYLLHKLFKRIALFENMLNNFFFNIPLRTLSEQYIDMILMILVNSRLIKFKNMSQFITTGVFAFGATMGLLLPFIQMNIIYSHRREIRKESFTRRFGMLTEEFRQKSILQLYYYPLWLF